MKCLEPILCDHVHGRSPHFEEHDLNCLITFEFCKECGLKSRRGSGNEHSCIKVIKDHYEGKLEQLKEETVKMKNEMENKLDKKLNEMMQEMAKMKKEQLYETEQKLKKERQRYEDFIALAVTGRNGFNDFKISNLDSYSVLWFRDCVTYVTSLRMKEIKDIIDTM